MYYHHSYFTTIAKKLPAIAATLIGICWLPPLIVYVFVYHDLYVPLVRISINGSVMIALIAILTAMLNKEIRKTFYVVNEDGVIKKTPYSIRFARFGAIARFRHVRLPLVNGYGKIEYEGGVIRLPFIIEHLPQCISDIEKHLEKQGKQGVFEADNIFTFKQKALISEQIIRQITRAFARLLRTSLACMAGSWIIAQNIWNLPLRWVVFWSLCGFCFTFLGFICAQVYIARVLERGTNKHDLSLPSVDEPKAYCLFGLGTFVVYLAAGIFLRMSI